jgi:sensor histidine kinase regulating citrate/malate metabolism
MKVLHISDNGVELILWKTQTKFLGCTKHSAIILNQKGIGLFQNQVDAMNGNIMVESKPNMGTTFKNLYRW